MIDNIPKYFNHTQKYYRFVILKKINEYGYIEIPIDINDSELIEAISKVHIHNLTNDGLLLSTDRKLQITDKGKECLNRHYIDFQIVLES